ncbi:MAG: hypothetical protein Phog2KO_47720 [Phototrophicaceae bacterium]
MQFWKRLFPDKQKTKPTEGHPYDLETLPTGARLHHQDGFELFQAGKLELAEIEFKRANEIAPWHKLPLFMLVYALVHQNKITQANEIIEELLDDSPLDSFAIFLQAHIKFYLQEFEEALQLYNKALYRRFWIANPYIERAWILIHIKEDFEKAKKDIEKIKLLDPENLAIYELGAKIAFHKNDHEKSLILLNKGLEIDPNNEMLLLLRGSYFVETAGYELAKNDLQQCLKINPNNPDTLYTIALIHFKKNELEQAVELFTKVIEIDPKNYFAWTFRGRCLVFLEQYDEAIKSCTKAIEIDPNDSLAYINRRHAFSRSKQYQKALADEDMILALEKPTGLRLRAHTLVALERYNEAIQYLDNLIEFSPNHADAYNGRAWQKSYIGEHQEAILDAEKAISLDDSKPNYHGTLGQAKWLMNDYEGALECYNQALTLEDSDLYKLEKSIALSKLDKQDEAISLWQEATSENAEFQSAEAYQDKYRFAPPFYEAMQALEKLAQTGT